MVSIEEAKKLAREKYGEVDFQGEYSDLYLFIKVKHNNFDEGFENVWVGKYIPRACDTPEEWVNIREEQNKLRGID